MHRFIDLENEQEKIQMQARRESTYLKLIENKLHSLNKKKSDLIYRFI